MDPIALKPIGHVGHGVPEADLPRLRAEMVAEIVIDEAYTEALSGLKGYSHLIVIYWMHRHDPARYCPMVHPCEDLPLTGVLSTRGRDRPNPIGLAVVELLAGPGTACRSGGSIPTTGPRSSTSNLTIPTTSSPTSGSPIGGTASGTPPDPASA